MTKETNSQIVDDRAWISDPFVLFKLDRLIEFFPTRDQTDIERLNAITRFGIYVSVVLAMYKRNINYLFLALIPLAFTFLIFESTVEVTQSKENLIVPLEKKQERKKEPKTVPTKNNPFMNPTMFDSPDRPQAEFYADSTETSDSVRADIADKFSYNLYQNADDIYGKEHSARQFYTIPNSDPNGDFKNFLYGDARNCKSNKYDCEPYQDPRRGRLMTMLETIPEEDF